MKQDDIKARVGTKVSEAEAVDMIHSMPLCSTKGDVKVRSAALTFTFGPRGLTLVEVEDRPPQTILERNPHHG